MMRHLSIVFLLFTVGCSTAVAQRIQSVTALPYSGQSDDPSRFFLPYVIQSTPPTILTPPTGKIYHAVYPGDITGAEDTISLARLQEYEQAAGKLTAWVYFSNEWGTGRSFPTATVTWIRDHGSVPYIRLMLRSEPGSVPEQTFTLERIIRGDFDADLRSWAQGARAYGDPLIVEYGTEVNGEWFPWNGKWNGAGAKTGYGDPDQADGPERFRDATRRIIDIFRQENTLNITWIFHANNGDYPEVSWNTLENYYPGDEWIDWLAVSAYGAQTPQDDWCDPFTQSMDAAYPRLASLSANKPIIVAEFGVTQGNPLCSQADWTNNALTDLIARRWPRVIGFSWWNEGWENDDNPLHNSNMRVQDNPALAAVFQTQIMNNNIVVGRPVVP
jgi:hypothetical protein